MNPHASQANNASKADQDSPFALLMAAAAPKEDEPVRAQEETQKPANDQPAPVKHQTRTEAKKTRADEKAKPDENKTAEGGGQDKQDEVANDNAAPVSTTDAKSAAANPVPQPVVPLIVIADAMEQSLPTETPVQEGVTPEPAQPAAQPVQDLAALTAATANDTAAQTQPTATTQAATQTQAAPQPQMQQAAVPQAGIAQPPASEMPQGITDPQPAAPQAAAQPTVVQQTAAPQAAAPQTDAAQDVAQAPTQAPTKEALVQIATLQNPSSAKPAETSEQKTVPVSTDTVLKTDTAQPVTHDIPAGHAENKDVKADAPRPEIVKSETAKPDMAQTATVETATPKSTPQVQTPPSTNMAAPQTNIATQPGAAPAVLPGMPQHVQVSAQAPAPNVPALAVEIAAKSQSGAKQFDIRLDPPELGRVEVRLSIDAAGKASAHLSADQPQTLELLQKDSSSLTRALREAGLNVSQDGLNFSLRQQNHDGNSAQQGQGQGRNASRGMNLIATNSIEATQASASYRGDGRLDIRV